MTEEIPISVNGLYYPTEMVRGVQRFIGNPIIRDLYDAASHPDWGRIDMNQISFKHGRGDYSDEDVRELYRLIGYAIEGYGEIFEEDEIKNPLWEEKK